MPRTARLVLPHMPHHVIQRGNRRQDVFFSDKDYRLYLSLLRHNCEKTDTDILAYCLMTNHIHLIAVPKTPEGLKAIAETNRLYARTINFEKGWRGHLWQDRFGSYPMDESYLYEALRYVELNPVRAEICAHPCDYAWSSARQRTREEGHYDYKVKALQKGMVENWEIYWQEGMRKFKMIQELEENETRLKPLGKVTSGTVLTNGASGTV